MYVRGRKGSTASDLRQLFSENAQIAQIKGRRLCPTRVKIADRHTEDELFVGPGGLRRLTLLPLKRVLARDRNIPHSLPSCNGNIKWTRSRVHVLQITMSGGIETLVPRSTSSVRKAGMK